MAVLKPHVLLKLATDRQQKITCAESCTGGMLAGAITDVPGSSTIFDRGYVTYSNAAKTDMLGVQSELIAAHGAVSEPVALAMADGARSMADADLAVAITGIAGPGGSDNKPEGRVCFALARANFPSHSETVEFGAIGRANVRAASVDHALDLLIAALS